MTTQNAPEKVKIIDEENETPEVVDITDDDTNSPTSEQTLNNEKFVFSYPPFNPDSPTCLNPIFGPRI